MPRKSSHRRLPRNTVERNIAGNSMALRLARQGVPEELADNVFWTYVSFGPEAANNMLKLNKSQIRINPRDFLLKSKKITVYLNVDGEIWRLPIDRDLFQHYLHEARKLKMHPKRFLEREFLAGRLVHGKLKE